MPYFPQFRLLVLTVGIALGITSVSAMTTKENSAAKVPTTVRSIASGSGNSRLFFAKESEADLNNVSAKIGMLAMDSSEFLEVTGRDVGVSCRISKAVARSAGFSDLGTLFLLLTKSKGVYLYCFYNQNQLRPTGGTAALRISISHANFL